MPTSVASVVKKVDCFDSQALKPLRFAGASGGEGLAACETALDKSAARPKAGAYLIRVTIGKAPHFDES